MTAPHATSALGDPATWHDVECGGYAADLALWDELAREAAGPVLELGAGTGRVALHLAVAGHEVSAVDADAALLAQLGQRARERGLEVTTHRADARELGLGARFGLIAGPMQFAHLLGGTAGRRRMLDGAARHLIQGGALALAILTETPPPSSPDAPLLPDVRERDGWVYSSQPLDVTHEDGQIVVRRLRQLVSPAGALTEEVDFTRLDLLDPETLVADAAAAGFALREQVEIPPTDDHVGSTVVVLEVADASA